MYTMTTKFFHTSRVISYSCQIHSYSKIILVLSLTLDELLFSFCLLTVTGTNGGVSGFGVFFSFVGGLTIGLAYYITLYYTVDSTLLERAPTQWTLILVGGLAGLLGSIIDSYIGATLQYSGMRSFIDISRLLPSLG